MVELFPRDIDGNRFDLTGSFSRTGSYIPAARAYIDGALSLTGIIGSRVGPSSTGESIVAIAQVEGSVSIAKAVTDKNMYAYWVAIPEVLRPSFDVE